MSAPRQAHAKVVKTAARTGPPHGIKAATDEVDGGEEETVSLYGDFHGGLTQIKASSVRLVLTFGEFSDGRDVLVPLVDWQTYGHEMSAGAVTSSEDRGPLLNSQMLSFDNLTFLLQDLAYDTRDAVRLLASQSKGGVAPVDDRTRYAARMLRLASKHLSTAAEQMEGLLEQVDEAEPADQPAQRAKPRRKPARLATGN